MTVIIYTIALILKSLLAYWCYCIAKKEQRNPIVAAVLTMLFGIIVIIVYYIIGDKYEERYDE